MSALLGAAVMVAVVQSPIGQRPLLEVTVTAPEPWPPGALGQFEFDHAAYVDAGDVLPDGSDLAFFRYHADGGLEFRDVVAVGWSTPDARVVFALDPWSDAGLHFGLSRGAPSSVRRDPRNVYLLHEQFDGQGPPWTLVMGDADDFERVDGGVRLGGRKPGRVAVRAPLTHPAPALMAMSVSWRFDDITSSEAELAFGATADLTARHRFGPVHVVGALELSSWSSLGQRVTFRNLWPFSFLPDAGALSFAVFRFGDRAMACVNDSCTMPAFPIAPTDGGYGPFIGLARVTSSSEVSQRRELIVEQVRVWSVANAPPAIEVVQRRLPSGAACMSDDSCLSGRCAQWCLGDGPHDGGGVPASSDAGPGETVVPVAAFPIFEGDLLESPPPPFVDQRRQLRVGCGCEQAGLDGLSALSLLAIWATRRLSVTSRRAAS